MPLSITVSLASLLAMKGHCHQLSISNVILIAALLFLVLFFSAHIKISISLRYLSISSIEAINLVVFC